MSKKILQQSTRHKETRREHGAESGSNDDNDIPHSSSRSKSVPALHVRNKTSTSKGTKRNRQQDTLTDSGLAIPNCTQVVTYDTTDSSDEVPITFTIQSNIPHEQWFLIV